MSYEFDNLGHLLHDRATNISGSKKKHRIAEKVGTMNKLGRVKLVFSRRVGEKTWIILATNHWKLGAKKLIEHDRQRWPIEILFTSTVLTAVDVI